jgi:hypothetical protein
MSFFRTFKSPDRFAQNAGEIVLEKFDYDVDGNLIYQGATYSAQGPDSAEIWAIAKFTYNGDGRLSRTEYRYLVSWDERAILDWLP